MSLSAQTPETVLKLVNAIFFILLFSIILFGWMAYYFIYDENLYVYEQENEELYIFLSLIVTVASALAGHRVFQNMIKKINPRMEIGDKLSLIRKAYIYQFALIELAAVFPIIISIVEGDILFLILTLFMLVLLIFKKPSRAKMDEFLMHEPNRDTL